MFNKKVSVIALFLFMLTQSFTVIAEEQKARGNVMKVSGDVSVISADGETRTVQQAGESLNENDTIVTNEGGSVIVEYDDGALSVLNEKSRLRVEKTRWFSYLGGKIYFTFKKVFGEPRRVRTRSATIGVRGTTFILSDDTENNSQTIALKEGLLDVESTGRPFEIHRKKEMDDFERFKQKQEALREQMLTEYEQYKDQTMKEFIEYKHQFTLQPDRVVSLSGNRVDETAMTEEDRAAFDAFEAEAEDIIKAFRERSNNEESQ